VPFGATRIEADLTTPLGLKIYRYGHWDEVQKYIDAVLFPGDIFIDGGANIGMMTIIGAHRVGPTGHVIALEPAELTRKVLEHNVAVGNHANVTVLPWALGEREEDRPFVVMSDNAGLSSFSPEHPEQGTVTTVSVRTLDQIIESVDASKIRLIKLDLEGGEVAALRGARRVLEESRAEFIVEVEPQHLGRQGADTDELYALFEQYGLRPSPLSGPNVLFSRSR
jgi:FkbM family methyltransferase